MGSVGEVLRARDGAGRDVALKRLLPSTAADLGVVASFEAETDVAGALDHENVPRLVDRGRIAGVSFAAYELVHGRDLRTTLERLACAGRRMPADVAAELAAQVADALAHVHARMAPDGMALEIVHRDVTPANVVVSFAGAVKLVDFGIARSAIRPALTARNEVRGTLRYVSPEQIAQEALDARSDLFSLGLVLWEMLVGRPALEGPMDVVLERIASGEVPPPRSVEPSVPAAIDAIVCKVLAKRREERYDSASKFSDALTAAARDLRGAEATPSSGNGGGAPFAARLAQLMRELFPGEVVEEQQMADDKGSSDLDVFEGLGKKSSRPSALGGSGAPPSVAPGSGGPASHRAPPPPPPSSRAPSTGNQAGKTTLLGVPAPKAPGEGAPPPSSAAPPPPPPSKRPSSGSTPASAAPPPPPTMSSAGPTSTPVPLPPPPSRKQTLIGVSSPVALPPPPSSGAPSAGPNALPPPPTSKVAPPVALPPPPQKDAAAAAGVEMDWDDDEESTHVFEKRRHAMGSGAPGATPRPAAGAPGPQSVKTGSAAALVAGSGQAARVSAPPPAGPQSAPPHGPQSGPPGGPQSGGPQSAGPQGIGPHGASPQSGSVPPPAPGRFGESGPSSVGPASMGAASSRRASEQDTIVRPRERDGAGRAGVVLGALALVAVGGLAAFLLWPRTGQLKIDLKSKDGQAIPRAEIFVDGVKRCDTAPCVVADLPAGAKTIRVILPGQAFVDAVETVEAGKEKLVYIAVGIGGAAPAASGSAPTASTGGTGLKLAGSQPGVKVTVDGVDKGGLPLTLSDLAPGEHKLKLDGGDRYEPEERTVTVGSGEVKDLGEVKLKVLKGVITLDLRTEGASVLLSGTTDGGKKVEKKLPDSIWKSPPVRLPIDLRKEKWTLVATRKGLTEFRRELDFSDGNPEPTIVIELGTDASATPTTPTTPPTPPIGGPLPTSAAPSGQAPPATGKPPEKDPGKEAATGQGTLNINSIPVSKVLLDGRPIGSTPKAGVSVSAGSHTVTFIKDGERKSVTVTVKAGETKVAAVKF